jgi:hypothetical protein
MSVECRVGSLNSHENNANKGFKPLVLSDFQIEEIAGVPDKLARLRELEDPELWVSGDEIKLFA